MAVVRRNFQLHENQCFAFIIVIEDYSILPKGTWLAVDICFPVIHVREPCLSKTLGGMKLTVGVDYCKPVLNRFNPLAALLGELQDSGKRKAMLININIAHALLVRHAATRALWGRGGNLAGKSFSSLGAFAALPGCLELATFPQPVHLIFI
jgi:hypothetical protein